MSTSSRSAASSSASSAVERALVFAVFVSAFASGRAGGRASRGRRTRLRSPSPRRPARAEERSPRPGAPGRGRRSLEDLRRAIAALESHLVRAGGPVRPVVEVDEEVTVDLNAAVRVAVDSEQTRAYLRLGWVVSRRVERV